MFFTQTRRGCGTGAPPRAVTPQTLEETPVPLSSLGLTEALTRRANAAAIHLPHHSPRPPQVADTEAMPRPHASRTNAVSRRSSAALSQPPLPARILWVLAAGAWLFAVASLFSVDPSDWPSHAVAVQHDPPANLGGRAGAMLAYQLLLVFGGSVWLLVIGSGASLVITASGRALGHGGVRAVGLLLATIALGGLHALLVPGWGLLVGTSPGLLGLAAATELGHRFSGVMVGLILVVALLIGLITAADRFMSSLPRRGAQLLGRAAEAFRGTRSVLQAANPAGLLRTVRAAWPARLQPVVIGRPLEGDRAEQEWSEAQVDQEELSEERPEPASRASRQSHRAGPGVDAEESVSPASRRKRAATRVSDATDESLDASGQEGDEDEDSTTVDAPEVSASPVGAAPRSATGAEAVAAAAAAAGEESGAPRQQLSEEELRAKIAKLPLRMTGRTKHVARDEDVSRSPSTEPSLEGYKFPSLELLENPETNYSERMESLVREQARVLEQALQTFSIDAEVVGIESGPVVTLFSVQLAPGTRVARLQTISSDIARSLQAHNIRILPNTAGKTTVGIEVPNLQKEKVRLKELMSGGHSEGMMLPMFLGKDASGEPLVADLTRMPHMLIAGTTGSGKSVCMNTIIMSWLYTKRPDELKLVLVDPKMVEMSQFADIPHLMCPVVTEMGRAAAILEWAVGKMEERYELLREAAVRDIASFNALGEVELYERFQPQSDAERAAIPKQLPYMVFVIDELADLMMTNKEVEHSIVRIAQKARAVGIHLILATQRPQANVVTGLIKSNMPCRASFKVASGMDSRIVLDSKGAELLLGQGDMLFLNPKTSEIRRAQGTLVSDNEIRRVTRFLKDVAAPSFERALLVIRPASSEAQGEGGEGVDDGERDPLFDQAVEIMIESGRGSVSLLQRRLAIGYSRASRLVDQMGQAGILGDHKGSVAREVMVSKEEWARMKTMRDEAEREGTVFESGDER
jgi:S-DNA-T family DNA segregation ATPase FtsK/SpoIIIE